VLADRGDPLAHLTQIRWVVRVDRVRLDRAGLVLHPDEGRARTRRHEQPAGVLPSGLRRLASDGERAIGVGEAQLQDRVRVLGAEARGAHKKRGGHLRWAGGWCTLLLGTAGQISASAPAKDWLLVKSA
jgi:hypothetical protein